MDLNAVIERILDKEWVMFHTVNGEDRVDCQNDREMFELMRRAQFSAWSEEAAASYLDDLQEAEAQGRNLVREKYIWMMENTDPEAYRSFSASLPTLTEKKRRLVERLWKKFHQQTERMRASYPVLAMGGRPMLALDEREGETSVQTYQTGEFRTYSEKTLEALLKHVSRLEEQGTDLVCQIQTNSVLCLGYRTLEEAEAAMANQLTFMAVECGDCAEEM